MANEAPYSHDTAWPVARLGDVTTKIGSGATPRGGSESYLPVRQTFAFVRSQNIFDRRFDGSTLAFITDEQANGLRGVALQSGDVLLNITGDGITFGRAALVDESVLPACVNQHVSIVRADPRKADPGYLLAYLTHPDVKPYIASYNSGGSRRAITKGNIESFRVPLPPIDEQRAIAATLGALDDKIESNRRLAMIVSLLVDSMAARLIADTETKSCSLRDLVDFNQVTLQPGPPSSEIWYIDIASVTPGEIADVFATTWAEAPSRARRGVADGDVIYSTVRPGRRSFAQILNPDPCTVVSTGFAVMTPSERMGSSLLTTVAGSPNFASYLESVAHGSAYPAVSIAAMGNYQVDLPSDHRLIAEFESQTMPLRRKVQQARRESTELAHLRDALLPELLSGRIRVPEAAESVA